MPAMLATELAALFARDLTRLRQQIEAFPDTTTLWVTAPGVSNAAGTLALQLEGNLLIHLSGHLNYHLGQIDYLRRVSTGSGAIPLAGLTA